MKKEQPGMQMQQNASQSVAKIKFGTDKLVFAIHSQLKSTHHVFYVYQTQLLTNYKNNVSAIVDSYGIIGNLHALISLVQLILNLKPTKKGTLVCVKLDFIHLKILVSLFQYVL